MPLIVYRGGPQSYTTSFPLTESVLSEGGRWVHYDPTLTNVIVENIGGVNVAHGTQSGGPFGPFDDSSACLTRFSENHQIEATVWLSGSITESLNKEVELLLRWQDAGVTHSTAYGDTQVLGYEINVHYQGAYGQVGLFKGALLQSFSSLPVPATGDKFRAQIQQSGLNAIIQCWWRPISTGIETRVLNYTDPAPVRGGSPGIGFYRSAGADNNKFGFAAYAPASYPAITAIDL